MRFINVVPYLINGYSYEKPGSVAQKHKLIHNNSFAGPLVIGTFEKRAPGRLSLSFINDDISLTSITKQIHYLEDKKASIKYSKPFVDKNLPNNVIFLITFYVRSHLLT